MVVLSADFLFDAAIRIMIAERSITLTFTENSIRIRFPTTRRFADFLEIPHYYVLPFFAAMEQEQLVTRAERVGILTTDKGSRKLIRLINARYREDITAIIGQNIFGELVRKYRDADEE